MGHESPFLSTGFVLLALFVFPAAPLLSLALPSSVLGNILSASHGLSFPNILGSIKNNSRCDTKE